MFCCQSTFLRHECTTGERLGQDDFKALESYEKKLPKNLNDA